MGEDGSDYAAGGRMQDLDSLFVECDDNNIRGATSQILARLLGPGYHRFPDQLGGSANPPYYLQTPTPRGRLGGFEWKE